jgi:hypothetical protein
MIFGMRERPAIRDDDLRAQRLALLSPFKG